MFYQTRDFEVIDYDCYTLPDFDEKLRGPQPTKLDKDQYLVCVGSAHTFGVFSQDPYPTLLKNRLKIEVLNLGFGSGGPEYFMRNEKLIEYINNSKLAILQITSARGASNSVFQAIKGGKDATLRSNQTRISAELYYKQLLQESDPDLIKKLVAESRQTWVDNYKALLQKIKVPKILFWFSTREPKYQESYEGTLHKLFGGFPQLVNDPMIQELKNYSDEYVECITNQGLPQLLISRFTGQPTSLKLGTPKIQKTHNNYYPSPEMHIDAANVLEPVCKKYLEQPLISIPAQIQLQITHAIETSVFKTSCSLQLIDDEDGYSIVVEGQPPITLKDNQGNITLERYPWIERFLAVRQVNEQYEVLYRQKNGDLYKWIANGLGRKQNRQLVTPIPLAKLAEEFAVDIKTLSVTSAISSSYPKPEKLIIHCCYHKVATSFFTRIFKKICQKFHWKFQESFINKNLQPETHIFLSHNSNIDWSNLPPYVGSHIIRDPRDMIISGYFYHLWCHEKWCHEKKPEYDNRSYQEVLNSVSQEEGITLEIKRVKGMIKNMLAWDYNNPNIIEIRLEELAINEKGVFEKVFQKYGFNQEQMDIALNIVDQLSFEKRTGRQRGEEDRKSHLRKGVSGDWKNYFTEEHKQLFKQLYSGALTQLGYEQDDHW